MNKENQINLGNALVENSSLEGITFVGVGPGDPKLLTLAAVEAIQQASLITYPKSHAETLGMAESIASRWIDKDKEKIPIYLPMTKDIMILQEAWRKAGYFLAKQVSLGKKVVFLCQGDVSLFSSTSYLFLCLKNYHPECAINLIPGVTGIAAASAVAKLPLCLQDEQLLILPTPDNPTSLESLITEAGSLGRVIVLLKLGNKWTWVRQVLKRMNLLSQAIFAQKVGWPDQIIQSANEISEENKPYFSLLIIRQRWPNVLP